MSTVRAVVLLSLSSLTCDCHLIFPYGRAGQDAAADRDATHPDATHPDATHPDATHPLPCQYYVNDDATTGDMFTTAKGNDGNAGDRDHPFATLVHALSVVPAGAVICVDTGNYPGNLVINQSVTVRGRNHGAPACNRKGVESIIQGFLEVAASAVSVTLDGVRLERGPTTTAWEGLNVTFSAPTFRLLNSIVVPSAWNGGYSGTGYVASPFLAWLSVVEIRNNDFLPSNNDSGVSAVAIPKVLGNGTVEVSNNCFTNSGGTCSIPGPGPGPTSTVSIYGSINQLTVDGNTITNPAGGAGGVCVGSPVSQAVIKKLIVTNNRIDNACEDGVKITQTVDSATVSGNWIHGSGAEPTMTHSANLRVATNLLTNYSINHNDLAAPTAGRWSVINESPQAPLTAPCNWFGYSTSAQITPLLSGLVTYTPFLTDANDTDPAPGFQPASTSCNGK